MQYRSLGGTKDLVSILGYGCMRFPLIEGDDAGDIDEDKARQLLQAAVAGGINYFDTAYNYHSHKAGEKGESEPFLGRFLAEEGLREQVFVASKLPSWLIESREDMDRILDEQLQRLQTDHIDFYLVHSLQQKTWSKVKDNGITDFLDQALKDGRIRNAGFSFHDQYPIYREILHAYDWSFCQIQLNYLDLQYQAGLQGMLDAHEKGVDVIAMEPLRGGRLAEPPKAVSERFLALQDSWSAAEWALRFLWDRDEISLLLSGMSTMAQVQENVEIASKAKIHSFTDQEADAVKEAREIYQNSIQVGCTACGYCMPCEFGVNIPGNFECYNDYYMFGKDASSFRFLSEAESAKSCVDCGRCEPLCPQNIAIPQRLKEVATLIKTIEAQ